jgi:uncharacterized membrane protein
MLLVFLAVLLFGVLHVVPGIPGVKASLRARLGKAYGPVYGIALLLALVLAIAAVRTADRQQFYDLGRFGIAANFALTLVAFVFLGIFLFRGSWRNAVRYPMAIAVMLWGSGHLLANGDGASFLFFGGLMIAAIVHVLLLQQDSGAERVAVRQGHNMLSIIFGIALYALMAQAHGTIIGVPVLQLPTAQNG